MRRPSELLPLACLLTAGLLGGCAGTATPTATIPAAELAQVSVEIRQSRADWADRVVQLRVDNQSARDLTVTLVELVSPDVSGRAASDVGAAREVPARWHRDFSVALGAPVCPSNGSAAATVTVHLSDGEGNEAVRSVAATDPHGHLARIHGEDCAAHDVMASARLSLAGDLAVEDHGGVLVGVLSLTVEPRAGTPTVTIGEIEGTVLLAPVGGVSWAIPELAEPLTTPTTARLEFTPSRCDPHAVAEDKRGTFLGVHASLDGVERPTFYLGVPAEVLGEVHDYVAQYCRW